MGIKKDAPEGRSIAINVRFYSLFLLTKVLSCPQARMLHDIKVDSLQIVSFGGAALEPLYHAPKSFSNLVAKDELKIYNGNCHCGAVTYSVRSELLTQTGPPVCECDCSICSRVSSIFSFFARGLTPHIYWPNPTKKYATPERLSLDLSPHRRCRDPRRKRGTFHGLHLRTTSHPPILQHLR